MKKPKVLIVDDSESQRNILRHSFSEGFEIEEAKNGREGLLAFNTFKPNVVLLDLFMPVLDGFGFLEELKPQLTDPYEVIAITSADSELNEIIKRCYDLGVSAFLRKPVNIIEVIAAVKRSVALKSLEKRHLEAEKKLERQVNDQTAELFHEVNRRKETLEALESSEARYEALFNQVPIGIFRCAWDGRLLDVNATMATISGYDSSRSFLEEVKSFYDIIQTYTLHKKLSELQGGEVFFEYQFKKKSGSSFPAQISIKEIPVGNGDAPLLLGYVEDIAKRKKVENALKKSEERFALAMHATTDGIWDWNLETGEVFFSERWFNILGYDSSELPSNEDTWKKVIHPSDYDQFMKGVKDHLSGKNICFRSEHRCRKKNGDYLWVSDLGMAIAGEDGKNNRIIGAHTDISERKRAEAEQKDLLENTLKGTIQVFVDILSMTNALLFGRAKRVSNYVSQMAMRLKLDNLWEYELAALLSQFGFVTIPTETIERYFDGIELSEHENEMIAACPNITQKIIAHIPRLKRVADMIGAQDSLDKKFDRHNQVMLGTALLKIGTEFDMALCRNLSRQEAILDLTKKASPSYKNLVSLLNDISINAVPKRQSAIRKVRISELKNGLILQENIVSENGVIIAPKGLEINRVLLKRLANYLKGGLLKNKYISAYEANR